MKIIVFMLILAIVIVGSGLWMEKYLAVSSEKLAAHFEHLEQALTAENWSEAGAILNGSWEAWNKTKKNWAPLIDHEEIDKLDLAVARITQYVNNKEHSLALAELAVLKLLVRHIPEKEAVNLQNIF
jgi:hypothetical protein